VDQIQFKEFSVYFLTLLVVGCRGGGGYYNHRLKNILPGRFLAVSLLLSILLYIRTSHSTGKVSGFKIQDLGASSTLTFIKGKLKKIEGPLSLEIMLFMDKFYRKIVMN
jgi:hypothetical protein